MKIILCGILFIFISNVSGNAQNKCPDPDYLIPCECEEKGVPTLVCSKISTVEILTNVLERSQVKKLKQFELKESELEFLPTNALVSKKIKAISIESTNLTSLFDSEPSASNKLERILLQNVRIENGVSWEPFRKLGKLKFLKLEDTEVGRLGDSFMDHVSASLDEFCLINTRTTEFGDFSFSKMTRLEVLEVIGNKITTLKRSMFATPAAIKNLYFRRTLIETLPEDLFVEMPHLTIIGLGQSKIFTLKETVFGNIYNQLTDLIVDKNPIECDCSLEWLTSRSQDALYGNCAKPLDKSERSLASLTENDFLSCH